MFDLYHAPEHSDYRRRELYDKIANDQLAKSAQGTDASSGRYEPSNHY